MTHRRPATEAIVEWYDRKTEFLLEKYGPGPRVHYHTGWAAPDIVPAADRSGLRRQLWCSQEDMIRQAARAWCGEENLTGDLLDVGCGQGKAARAKSVAATAGKRRLPSPQRSTDRLESPVAVAPVLAGDH